MKRTIIGIIILLLIGSVLLNITLLSKPLKKENTISGTYISGMSEENATYIVLTSEGEYCQYKQFELLEEDTYDVYEEERLISLKNNNRVKLLYNDDKLYYIYDGNIITYNKTSDTPTYININK